RLRELIHASVDQDSEQRSGDALAHGPAFERSANIYAVTVALDDQAPLPGDDESRGQLRMVRKPSTAALSFDASTSAGSRAFGSTSPMGQGTVAGSGNWLFTIAGLKWTVVSPSESATQP